MYTYLYNNNSESGNALSQALGALRIRHEGSSFRGRHDKVVINWGSGDLPREVRKCAVVNTENAVYSAINKILCLNLLHREGVPHIEYTSNYNLAVGWAAEPGVHVYVRECVTGHDGAGLSVYDRSNITRAPQNARLYTKGVPIDQEYRVTVVKNGTEFQVLAGQRKVKHDDAERTTNNLVRTSSNGWGFKLINHERYLPASVRTCAVGACSALGLDFCGVDVVLLPDGSARVLEVNTAPELTPTVLQRLATHLRNTYNN